MTGLERNSDLVVMSAYAPLFVNVNPGGMQWSTDLIGYDALNSYGSPAYYAQVMFASCLGDQTMQSEVSGAGKVLKRSTSSRPPWATGGWISVLALAQATPWFVNLSIVGLAAVLVAVNRFEVQELEIPDIPEDGGLLKIEACGICGSDARIRERIDGGPKIMGHENVGSIARLGRVAAQRWQLKEGDRVALEEYVTCGACRWCRSGYFRYCALTAAGALRYGSTPLAVWPAPQRRWQTRPRRAEIDLPQWPP